MNNNYPFTLLQISSKEILNAFSEPEETVCLWIFSDRLDSAFPGRS